jgi:hypothetical protein
MTAPPTRRNAPTDKATAPNKATQKAAKKKAAKKKATKKKATKKKATTKKATKKKATKKKATTKKASKKVATKKATKATKKAAKKKATTKATTKTAKKKATKKVATTTKATKKVARPTPRAPLTPKKSLDLAALAISYRDGDALAHPVTAEQMAEVSRDGLRDDDVIIHVDDNAEVAPCRLVDHGEGRFSLCLDDLRMPSLPLFDERGLQGGGFTWEAVADSLARLRRPELVEGLSYDSEAGMFVAVGTRPTLIALAHLLQEAMADPALLRQAVDAADPDRLE